MEYFNSIGSGFIDNSQYFSIESDAEANQLFNINRKTNAINFYIVNNLWDGVQGMAASVLSNAFVVNLQSVESGIASHEMGHCLDLFHTFQGTRPNTSGCAEAINGSNCTTCGDLVCDTPADRGDGAVGGYNPDMRNLMSYYYLTDRFTNGQRVRMKYSIINNPILQQVVNKNCVIPNLTGPTEVCSNQNVTYNIQNANGPIVWETSSNVNVVSQSTTSITVQPKNLWTQEIFVEAQLPFETKRINTWVGAPLVGLNTYCDDVFSTYCDLNSAGVAGSLPRGSKIYFGLNGRGISSTGPQDWEWERVFGDFLFVNEGGAGNVIDKGQKNIAQSGVLQINGSGTLQFKVRAKNDCGWGNWKYIVWHVTVY